MFADVADYSEWKTGRRFTGIVFATIGFALKAGLALGSASFLWIHDLVFPLRHQQFPTRPGNRARLSAICVGIFDRPPVRHLHGSVALPTSSTNALTIQMADELAERRKQFAAQTA